MALVDVVVYAERFVASRAMWDAGKMRTVVLALARPGVIGGVAAAGYLPEIADANGRGAWLELDAETAVRRVWAPIAPGLVQLLPVRSLRWLEVGQGGVLAQAPAVLALDGEQRDCRA